MRKARFVVLSSCVALAFLWTSWREVYPQPAQDENAQFIRDSYDKLEYQIPMRDGVKLFTSVYVPKDHSQSYPILLNRTPYTVQPYGKDKYKNLLGPSMLFAHEKYIFAYQDVRGQFMSEGEFVNVRPQIDKKKSKKDIDESSDTYDTIEWLLKNVPSNNGKVGIWGISYPGFYAAVGAIDAHPALKAVSPQAPIADWFWDDFHHHGAFFLPHAFNFFANFGQPQPRPSTQWAPRFDHGTPDGYEFFLEYLGPLKNADAKFFHGKIAFWDEMMQHPSYDAFWQARNLRPHLKKINPAVMTVGGWFDAEDLFGPLKIYRAIEENSPGTFNILVMGPWQHGGWARTDGTRLGNVFFTDNPPPSKFYQENIELPFFNYYLKGKGTLDLPEAYVFETGTNRWLKFATWPPQNVEKRNLYFQPAGKLAFAPPAANAEAYDEFISDPNKPVPFTQDIAIGMTVEYMSDDQRFAARRPDVLVYRTDVLEADLTFAGSMMTNLQVATTGTDADWIVKLIDVHPDTLPDFPGTPRNMKTGGYQQMVRSEVIRGRFRNSYEKPEPFVPSQITAVHLELLDVLHTFKKGHRIMVQVQSTWFPLVDRNPQKYVDNIYDADAEDFIKATHRVYHSAANSSFLEVGILR